ncbi:4-(cytidine 5'-diphospho)-2-C-methyl-D-erythritol kinase [Methyloceanibacter sp.]|uniref:4-(cytidine 5'-diphospho)-2-C-methyl-D-erythritol kinase n=1 Tax=Methyloceanibacter sp. TaxID=1965321 RepID=UPI003D6CCDBC
MTALRDTAKAKLNLTLEVLGRRDDGYHELKSLVAFAELGDAVELEPQDGLDLLVEGPFATALRGDNLILKAALAAKAIYPALKLGRFNLTKTLPVAAGLGGGSADAACALRLLSRASQGALDEASWRELAGGLGSDVPACLLNRPALMTGRGETVTPVRRFPPCAAVLANPGLPLAAADVYGVLVSSDLAAPPERPEGTLDFGGSFKKLLDYAARRGNDLEPAALSLAPAIAEVLAALRDCEGTHLARLSGSGPTCFALFATEREAERAAAMLRAVHPNWWIEATMLMPN